MFILSRIPIGTLIYQFTTFKISKKIDRLTLEEREKNKR